MLSLGYWYAIYAGEQKVKKQKLEAEKSQLEANHLKTELALLKSQFNPHLLYNALNYFYGRINRYDQDLAEHIISLSDILRYSLQGQPDTKVALQEEIEYLKSFIELHKARFHGKAYVDFHIQGDTQGHQILPLVLISFVENAFKHGEHSDPSYPIQIGLTVSEKELVFRVHNRKRSRLEVGQRVVSTGLGQENARRRLELVCADQYQLDIDNQQEVYTVQLTLQSVRSAVPAVAE